MSGGFVAADSARWFESLRHVDHDFYHLPSYGRFAARMQVPGEPLAFVAQDRDRWFVLPVIVRSISPAVEERGETLLDISSPRGYPGPVLTRAAHALDGADGDDDDFVDRAIEEFVEACRERNIVTAYIRMHPLLSPGSAAFERAGSIVDHGDSVSIDLGLSTEELWRQTRHGHRSDIRKAARLGYTARIDETWGSASTFAGIYQETMRRLGADPVWMLSEAYFDDLRATLGDTIHLCIAEVGGEVAAGAVLTEVDGIVEYHLAGTADGHTSASPSKLIVDFARSWAKARGNRCLHLGGSLRRGDSLMDFKAGFSPLRHPVRSWRVVVDPVAYRVLTDRWQARLGPGPVPSEGYFPAYRAPGTRPTNTPQHGGEPD